MSGGVDSSVAAALMLEKGTEVIGVTLKFLSCSDSGKGESPCCGTDDGRDAAKVCEKLGIPHYLLDAAGIFKDKVLEKSWNEYSIGRTPNPCVVCNRFVKFGFLLDYAVKMGASGVASGHHAIIEHKDDGSVLLRRGNDPNKDQSYFLSQVGKEQLEKIYMPVGLMTKKQVREEARRLGLPNSEKAESQDACVAFSGANFAETLRTMFNSVSRSGNFIGEDGEILGTHSGIHNFTIGQRRGFGKGFGRPVFVKEINAQTGDVVLVFDEEKLFRKSLQASGINWLMEEYSAKENFKAKVQIRYRQKAVDAEIIPSRSNPTEAEVIFEIPQRAVTLGQAVVFYENDIVIGGGWIR